jgi:hypothetical protein
LATALEKLQLTDGDWQEVEMLVFLAWPDDPTGEHEARGAGERWVAQDPQRRQYRLEPADHLLPEGYDDEDDDSDAAPPEQSPA